MRPLTLKLLRDLAHLKGQVATIAVVVACGIAAYLSLGATFRALSGSRDAYYERYRFPDVFCRLERAPESVRADLEAIPGVARVYTRLERAVLIPLPDGRLPAYGQLLSLPRGEPPLAAVYLREGRLLEPGRTDEVLLLDSFAKAHRLRPGDSLEVVVSGKLRRLRIVGLALSPEHVFGMAPGDLFGDPARYAALWMDREAMAPAFALGGAFDSVVLSLQPGARLEAVLADVDRLLIPYGSGGAHGRDRQVSHRTLSGELQQLQGMATTIPAIFLGVAAFLLNVVLSRLVQLQRGEIATLKAVGYRDREIGLHYLELVSLVVLVGVALGIGLGQWIGEGFIELYRPFFRFPNLAFRLEGDLVAVAALVSLGAAVAGGLGAVRAIARLPPAEAMRPPAPALYRRALLERLGLGRLVGPAGRMVLRELSRRPLRTAISALGLALAVAILVAGRFGLDTIDYFIEVQFRQAQRQDLLVTFLRPLPERALRELAHLPGVGTVEGLRAVPVRFRFGHVYRDSSLTGHPEDPYLQQVFDRHGVQVRLPAEGVVLDRKLGEILGLTVGDRVTVEILEGERRRHEIPVVAFADETLGLAGRMQVGALRRLLGEDRLVSLALLTVDAKAMDEVKQRLLHYPNVIAAAEKSAFIREFYRQSGESLTATTILLTLFAAAIAIGVVYNNARVSLSQRGRELASLRVLGFTRGEVSAVLLGEMAVQVALAIPLGLWLGNRMAYAVAATVDPETFRLPMVLSSRTYAMAVVVVLVASILSALIVRRRVDRLDLVAVLKTRE